MKKKTHLSLTSLVDAAFQQAAKKVIERAEQTGTPVIVWEDEQIKKLSPREARTRLAKKTKLSKKKGRAANA